MAAYKTPIDQSHLSTATATTARSSLVNANPNDGRTRCGGITAQARQLERVAPAPVLALSLLLLAGSAPALAEARFVLAGAVVDVRRSPPDAVEAGARCLKDAACRTVVDAAFAYFGINSKPATTALAQVDVARVGDIVNTAINLPAGYKYCRSAVFLRSIRPGSGSKAPLIEIEREWAGIGVKVDIPELSVGAPGAAFVADFTVVGVRDADAAEARTAGLCDATARPGRLMTCSGREDSPNRGKDACPNEARF